MGRADDNWGPVAFERQERYAPAVIRDGDRHGGVHEDDPTRVEAEADR